MIPPRFSPSFYRDPRKFPRLQDLDYEGVEDAQFLTPVRSSRGTIDVEGGPIQTPSSPWPEDREGTTWPEEYEEDSTADQRVETGWEFLVELSKEAPWT